MKIKYSVKVRPYKQINRNYKKTKPNKTIKMKKREKKATRTSQHGPFLWPGTNAGIQIDKLKVGRTDGRTDGRTYGLLDGQC